MARTEIGSIQKIVEVALLDCPACSQPIKARASVEVSFERVAFDLSAGINFDAKSDLKSFNVAHTCYGRAEPADVDLDSLPLDERIRNGV